MGGMWKVLFAALLFSAHARPNEDLLNKLDELRAYIDDFEKEKTVDTNMLAKELFDAPFLLEKRGGKPYDDYDPDAPVLPPNYSITLTATDIEDMENPEVTDEELYQQEQEVDRLGTEIEQIEEERKRELIEVKRQLAELNGLSPEKRGIASVIVWSVTIGSTGYQLYNIMTRGCGSFPSICEDKAKIETLSGEIEKLKDEYDAMYVNGLNEYLALQNLMDNNWYIKYHTNETVNAMGQLDVLLNRTILYLNANLVTLSRMFNSGAVTSEEYLDQVIGPLEMALGDLENMLNEVQQGSAKMLAINIGAQMLMAYFLDSYAMAKKQLQTPDDGRLDNVVDPDVDQAKLDTDVSYRQQIGAKIKGGMKSFGSSLAKRFRITRRAFYNMATRPFVFVSGGIKQAGGVKKYFSPRRIYNNVKAAALGKMQRSLTKIKSAWTKLKTGGIRQFSVKGFKLQWSFDMTGAISVGLDIMAAYQSHDQWRQVSEEMAKQRIRYEDYKSSLIEQRTNLTTDMAEVQKEFTETIDTFQEISGAYTDIIENATQHSEVADATNIGFGYTMSNPIFSPAFFTGLTKDNLENKQLSVIAFIRDDVNSDFLSASNMLEGRVVFYEKCTADWTNGVTVAQTLASVKEIMEYTGALEQASFGQALSEKDVVCYHALVHSDVAEYDFYNLAALRPVCDVTPQQWANVVQAAKESRWAQMTSDEVQLALSNRETSVTDILQDVVTQFSRQDDAEMSTYANQLTAKDILCVIARKISDAYFDYYELAMYRDNPCSSITDAQHTAAETAATQLRMKSQSVKLYVDMCNNMNNCFCFTMIHQAMQGAGPTSEDEVKMLMKQIDPSLTQWCASPMYTGMCTPMCVTL